jgi:2,3-bisphosphoglycerate-dependent phosphoglycerate mutase
VQLILVRHALPERVHHTDRTGVPEGPADPPLTELGHRQAARLVQALGRDVTAVYASPLARALATAAPLAAALGGEPRIDPDLREYDADARSYIPVHDMARLDPTGWERILAGLLPEHVDLPAFVDRVDAALMRIVAAHPGRSTAVVVAHAGVINVWLARLLGISRPLAFPLDYAGITRVIVGRDGRRVVRTVNETAHVADLIGITAGSD